MAGMSSTSQGEQVKPLKPEYKWLAHSVCYHDLSNHSLPELAWGHQGQRHPRILEWLERRGLSKRQLAAWVKSAAGTLCEIRLGLGADLSSKFQMSFAQICDEFELEHENISYTRIIELEEQVGEHWMLVTGGMRRHAPYVVVQYGSCSPYYTSLHK